MAQLIIEGMDFAQSKDLKFTLFSGDEKNMLAWANALKLTSYSCLMTKFEQMTEESTHVKEADCLDDIKFGSNILFELFENENKLYVNMRHNGNVLQICGIEDTPPSENCELENFKIWMRDTFMLDNFADYCGTGDTTVLDTVALQDELAFYGLMKTVMMFACIGMIPVIILVWLCMSRQNKKENSDFARELSNFNPNNENGPVARTGKGGSNTKQKYDDRLRSQPTHGDEIMP
jgi:hypothetical protein